MQRIIKSNKMSRIGKKPITVLEGIEVIINKDFLIIKGKNGEINLPFESEFVLFEKNEDKINVKVTKEVKINFARQGLYRSLLANAIEGVNKGFEKKLEIRGVGYKVTMKGEDFEFRLGFSHEILFKKIEGVKMEIDKENNNIIIISGIDKQKVGQVAANIRELKKPDPYKGKGIRYIDEYVVRKAGKSAAK
jgi:large subunit ribosomal protein L6